ncbi:hypothetical protein BGZ60DRAFT_535607 [Tricladium varicosporioides]|nr:hypothetical protein BGZ60DRAFT_535607 [Hymenoscyphus varicosporioides]
MMLLVLSLQPVLAFTSFEPNSGNPCRIKGDIDIYGPGIRLCCYLQWISIILTPYLLPPSSQKHFPYIRTTANGLIIAIYATTLANLPRSLNPTNINCLTSQLSVPTQPKPGSLIILEAQLIYSLTFLLPFSLIPTSPLLFRKSRYSLLIQAVLGLMINFAQPWLWFKAVEMGRLEACDVKVFMLVVPVGVYGKWETVFKVVSVLCAVLGFVMMIGGLLWAWNQWKRQSDENAAKDILRHNSDFIEDGGFIWMACIQGQKGGDAVSRLPNSREEQDCEDDVQKMLRWPFAAAKLLSGSLAIIQTELMIRINHIDASAPLTSSGQMIALVMGIVSLLVTLGSGLLFFVETKIAKKKRSHPTKGIGLEIALVA